MTPLIFPRRRSRRLFLLVVVFIVVLAGGVGMFLALGFLQPPFDREKYGTADYNVTYCTAGDEALELDVYYPDSGGPWPLIVNVHGGGWTEGDKSGVDPSLTTRGFLVVSINYRMYPDHRFPAMIEDVKCAIRYLRAHARQYNLNPDKVGLIGHSAGSHLIALAALADESAGWDVGEWLDQSSRVQAVVTVAGPYDLSRPFPPWVNSLIENVFGEEQQVSGSPVTYASPDDPPFLIIHGDQDNVVPAEQAQILYDAITSAGGRAELLIVGNAMHGMEPWAGKTTNPPMEEVWQRGVEFFEQTLR